MNVANFMSRQVVTVTPKTPLHEVWKIIFKKHIHGLPVVDERRKLLGIIAEEDLLAKLFPEYDDLEATLGKLNDDEQIKEKLGKLKKLTAEKIMSKRIVFTRPDTEVMRALSRMIVRKVRQLPVVDDDDRLVGMISKSDIFRKLFNR